jgi:predicted transcriptional regulator
VKAAVKLKILEALQEELRKELAGPQQKLESYPSSTSRHRIVTPSLGKPRLTYEHALQWQEAAISCVLHRACEGHNVTVDELIEQISPDDELVDEARRFMDVFLAILERKGYSSRPAMMP